MLFKIRKKWQVNGFGLQLEEFVNFVESIGLQYLLLLGSEFTFFENGSGGVRSRLNRFLVKDFLSGWSKGVVEQVAFKFFSDHLPILLSSGVISSGPCPFQFFNVWCDFSEFCLVVKEE